MRLYERRWRKAGRDCDISSAMLNIGKQSSKRPREAEEIAVSLNVPDASLNLPGGLTTPDSSAQRMQALNRPIPETDYLLSLPLLSEELGRLPVYSSFGYQPTLQLNELPYPAQSYPGPLIEPEQVLSGFDPVLDSIFPTDQDGITPSGGENISFNIPVGDRLGSRPGFLRIVTKSNVLRPADIISAVSFDATGNFLATGDKGGRVVLFERNQSKQRAVEYKFYTEFQSHEPEFDYLRSSEIEEKINKIRWCA
ncbi:hypothetical protein C8R45DRAFT_1211725 [Mycena sanguinolenta]|nr:hypothetical protein C8R45DRAFT_1211725 [Mycena sanguinolenta]